MATITLSMQDIERLWIREYVKKNPGIKAIQLCMDALGEIGIFLKAEMLEDMVKSGMIREEEYSDPGMEYRIKSRYYVD